MEWKRYRIFLKKSKLKQIALIDFVRISPNVNIDYDPIIYQWLLTPHEIAPFNSY